MSINSHFFKREEFTCECGCGFDAVDEELLEVLEHLRLEFDKPVIITGGNRCKEHNEKAQKEANSAYIANSSKSQHVFGKAVDLKVVGIDADEVADYLLYAYPNSHGIGRYVGRTHIDVRDVKARWDERS